MKKKSQQCIWSLYIQYNAWNMYYLLWKFHQDILIFDSLGVKAFIETDTWDRFIFNAMNENSNSIANTLW